MPTKAGTRNFCRGYPFRPQPEYRKEIRQADGTEPPTTCRDRALWPLDGVFGHCLASFRIVGHSRRSSWSAWVQRVGPAFPGAATVRRLPLRVEAAAAVGCRVSARYGVWLWWARCVTVWCGVWGGLLRADGTGRGAAFPEPVVTLPAPAHSLWPSGTPSPALAPGSASAGSPPSPASPGSVTPPASWASGTPSSPARSVSLKPPPAPRCRAPTRTGQSP